MGNINVIVFIFIWVLKRESFELTFYATKDIICYFSAMLHLRPKKKKCYVALSRPTVKCEKTGSFFFFFFLKCQIWAKNLLKFVFNGLKKHLHDLYMRFDCIPPEFSPFRNFKKNIGKLNSHTVRKKKKKKILTDRPNFQILVGWGQHNNFFFFGLTNVKMDTSINIPEDSNHSIFL